MGGGLLFLNTCMQAHMCACEGQKTTWVASLRTCPPQFFEIWSLIGLESVDHQGPGSHVSPLPQPWDYKYVPLSLLDFYNVGELRFSN